MKNFRKLNLALGLASNAIMSYKNQNYLGSQLYINKLNKINQKIGNAVEFGLKRHNAELASKKLESYVNEFDDFLARV